MALISAVYTVAPFHLSLAPGSSSLTDLDSPTNFVLGAAPNTEWSLSRHDYAAKGYGSSFSCDVPLV